MMGITSRKWRVRYNHISLYSCMKFSKAEKKRGLGRKKQTLEGGHVPPRIVNGDPPVSAKWFPSVPSSYHASETASSFLVTRNKI